MIRPPETGSTKKGKMVKDESLFGEWLDVGRGSNAKISGRNNPRRLVMPLLTEILVRKPRINSA